MNILLEICAGSLHSALAAEAGGAHRIELCDNISEGGTTPSAGTIRQTLEQMAIPVSVLIRPRVGDFLYTDAEFEAMKDDIRFCKAHGVKGVVLGILKKDGSIDMERTAELVRLASPMKVTFHRAFDMTGDPFRAMEDIISLGIERILTSGQAISARDGVPLIAELVRRAAGRIIIMPGAGITEDNVSDLVNKTGVREVHASLRMPVKSMMNYKGGMESLGAPGNSVYTWLETDPQRVKRLLNA